MEKQLTYYDGTATNAINCYKTINNYGDTFIYKSTVSPSPATMVPQIFCKYRPHDMPKQSVILKTNFCNPYKTMNQR